MREALLTPFGYTSPELLKKEAHSCRFHLSQLPLGSAAITEIVWRKSQSRTKQAVPRRWLQVPTKIQRTLVTKFRRSQWLGTKRSNTSTGVPDICSPMMGISEPWLRRCRDRRLSENREDGFYRRNCYAHRGICRSVIQSEFAARKHDCPARKDHIGHITNSFVRSFWAK